MGETRRRAAAQAKATGAPPVAEGEPERLFMVTWNDSAARQVWPEGRRQLMTLAQVRDLLADPRHAVILPGNAKDGPCFIPGWLEGTTRRQDAVAGLSLFVGDSDNGTTVATRAAGLRRLGIMGFLGSTHGHMSREASFRITGARWEALRTDAPGGGWDGAVLRWVCAHFAEEVAAGGIAGWVQTEDRGQVVVNITLNRPVEKWRIILPLAADWVAWPKPGVQAARQWRDAYLLAAAGAGCPDVDPTCRDPARLFYGPRQPRLLGQPTGVPGLLVQPEFLVVPGRLATLDELVDLGRSDGDARNVARARREAVRAALLPVGGGGAGQAGKGASAQRRGAATVLTVRPGVDGGADEAVDLEAWHRRFGQELLLADLFQARAPHLIDDTREETAEGHLHVVCPQAHLHSSDRVGGTYAWNGSGWAPPGVQGRKRGGIYCCHHGCQFTPAGQWLAALIEDGVVAWSDLDEAEGRVLAARQAAAAGDFSVADEADMEDEGDGQEGQDRRAGQGADEGHEAAGAVAGGTPVPAEGEAQDAQGGGAVAPASGRDGGHGSGGDADDAGEGDARRALKARDALARRLAKEGDEDAAALMNLRWQATERWVQVWGEAAPVFYDLHAQRGAAKKPHSMIGLKPILMADYGFPTDVLKAWAQISRARVEAGLRPATMTELCVRPGKPPVLRLEGVAAAGGPLDAAGGWAVNLWRPGVLPWPAPVRDDDPCIQDFLTLVRNNTGDDFDVAVVLWYFGDMLCRRGGARITWFVLMQGLQGTGKNFIAELMVAMLGAHNATVQPFRALLRASENTFLLNELIVVDEAGVQVRRGYDPGMDAYDFVKSAVTAVRMPISRKYVSSFDAELFGRFFMLANDLEGLPLPPDDRRCYPIVARGTRLDEAFSASIQAALDGTRPDMVPKIMRWLMDGYAALTAQHGFTPWHCPSDRAPSRLHQQVVEASMPPVTVATRDVLGELAEGEPPRSVVAFDEVQALVAMRMRLTPGQRASPTRVREGLAMSGWFYAGRTKEAGRGTKDRMLWTRSAGPHDLPMLMRQWIAENAKGDAP